MAPLFGAACCIFLLVLSSSSSALAVYCSGVSGCDLPGAGETVTCFDNECLYCSGSTGSPPVAVKFDSGLACTAGCNTLGTNSLCRTQKNDPTAVCLVFTDLKTIDESGSPKYFNGGCGFCNEGYVVSTEGFCEIAPSPPPPDPSPPPPDPSPPPPDPSPPPPDPSPPPPDPSPPPPDPSPPPPDPSPPPPDPSPPPPVMSPPPPPVSPSPPPPIANKLEGQSGPCAGDSIEGCAAPVKGSVTCFNNQCSYCDLDEDSNYKVPSPGDPYSCGQPCVGALSATGADACKAKALDGQDPYCRALSSPYFAKSATYRTKDGNSTEFDGICSVCTEGTKLNKERTKCEKDKSGGGGGTMSKALLAIILTILTAVIAGIIGLGFYCLQLSHQNRLTRRTFPLADYLRTDLKLRKVSNFTVNPGLQFRHAMEVLSTALDERAVLRPAKLLGNIAPSLAMAIAAVLRVRYGFQPRHNETEFLVLFARDCGDEVSRASLAGDIEAMVSNNPGWHGLLVPPNQTAAPRVPHSGYPVAQVSASAPPAEPGAYV